MIYYQIGESTNKLAVPLIVFVAARLPALTYIYICVCAPAGGEKKPHYKQKSVHRDEADGNQSLDRPGTDEVGEEETGLAGQSNHPQEHQLKQFLCKSCYASLGWLWTTTQKGRQIITVVHSDEATVPDWNINVRKKKGGGVRVPAICFLCVL